MASTGQRLCAKIRYGCSERYVISDTNTVEIMELAMSTQVLDAYNVALHSAVITFIVTVYTSLFWSPFTNTD